MTEMVYGVGLTDFNRLDGLRRTVFSSKTVDIVAFNLSLINGFFFNRGEAEKDESFKQVIPYVVFKADDGTYLTYRRAGSEERLQGLHTIGIGGHINPEDVVSSWRAEMVFACMLREIKEELEITGLKVKSLVDRAELQGLIYDPSNEVGRVHLGAAYVIPIKAENKSSFSIKSEGSDLTWKTAKELKALGGGLENWSRIILGNL